MYFMKSLAKCYKLQTLLLFLCSHGLTVRRSIIVIVYIFIITYLYQPFVLLH